MKDSLIPHSRHVAEKEKELVYTKNISWLSRIAFGVPGISLLLLITVSLGLAMGDSRIVVPFWVVGVFLIAMAIWMFVPIQFRVFVGTGSPHVVLTDIRMAFVAVRKKNIPYEQVEIDHGVVNVVLDELNICSKCVVCVHGGQRVSICGSWMRWFFGIDDSAIMQIYNGVVSCVPTGNSGGNLT